MVDFFCLSRQSQDQIMILAAIIFFTEPACLGQQFPGKGSKMTDVIISPQVIDCKIRFTMISRDLRDIRSLKE